MDIDKYQTEKCRDYYDLLYGDFLRVLPMLINPIKEEYLQRIEMFMFTHTFKTDGYLEVCEWINEIKQYDTVAGLGLKTYQVRENVEYYFNEYLKEREIDNTMAILIHETVFLLMSSIISYNLYGKK